jgi:antibiotic biosynthesis monooxygenase (ABM) superfamily enzyme
MLILNITFLVSNQTKEKWLKWVKDKHIPFMMNTGHFSKARVARVISNEENDGTSYAVQYETDSIESLENWNRINSEKFQKHCYEDFSTSEILFFSTVLEII